MDGVGERVCFIPHEKKRILFAKEALCYFSFKSCIKQKQIEKAKFIVGVE